MPIVSYNYGAGNANRNREILKYSSVFAVVIMLVATIIFFICPGFLIHIFSTKPDIELIGCYAFPVISISFIFAGLTIVITAYLQGLECIMTSLFIIVLRQIVLLVPLAWLLHFIGLKAVWWTFPVTEIVTSLTGIFLVKKSTNRIYEKREKT